MTTIINGSSPVGYQAMMASGGGAYNSAFAAYQAQQEAQII